MITLTERILTESPYYIDKAKKTAQQYGPLAMSDFALGEIDTAGRSLYSAARRTNQIVIAEIVANRGHKHFVERHGIYHILQYLGEADHLLQKAATEPELSTKERMGLIEKMKDAIRSVFILAD